VLVSHDLDTVAHWCDRALLLHRGRVAAIGEPDDVIDVYRPNAVEAM
jgi:ABC-type polysaccharide/polyol phosphate transport system ATPase subunit